MAVTSNNTSINMSQSTMSANNTNASPSSSTIQPRPLSMVNWVCSQFMCSARCVSKGQGQTYAPSPASDSAETKHTRARSEERSQVRLEMPKPLERAISEISVAGVKSSKPVVGGEDVWAFMGFKGTVRVKSADLNVIAPQSL